MKFFKNLFGIEDKRDTSYGGVKPYTSINEFSLGKQMVDELSRRMSGEGVGFGEDFVNRSTEPTIANREARFKEFEMPALNSELSSRGMARSTLAGDLLRRSFQDKERDISSILAERYLQDETQKRNEINSALGQSQGVTGLEMDTRAKRAAFDYGDYNTQLGIASQHEDADQAAAGKIAQVAAMAAAAPFTGGSSLQGLPGVLGNSGSGGGSTTNDWLNQILTQRMLQQQLPTGGFQPGTSYNYYGNGSWGSSTPLPIS